MRRFCSVSIALVAAALNAQQKIPKPETCRIEGQVVNAATGESVKKAEVVLFRAGAGQSQRYTAVTAAGGRFAMRDIEPGRYRLMVGRSGYARLEYGARAAGRPGVTLSLDPGQDIGDIVFRVAPQAVITGRAVDEDGDPVPNIQVQALYYRFVRGRRQMQPWSVDTNDLGEYRLFGLPPGRYYLCATSYEEMSRARYSGAQSYAPTYYPGTGNFASATAIDLRAGAVLRGIDITVLKTRLARVRGHLVNALTKQPPNGVRVWLAARGDIGGRMTFGMPIDDQGAFELPGVTPGAYYLEASEQVDGKTYSARLALDVGESDVDNISAELVPSFELKGQLRVEGRPPASLTEARVSLDAGEIGRSIGQTGADGSFTLTNIAPDEYRLNVSGVSEDYYVKSARLGDKDVLDAALDLSRGAAGSLDVVLSANGGQIEGVVLNAEEQPAMGAVVALVPDEPRRALAGWYKQVTTDQYGRFTVRGIAPGGYKLFAWEDVDDGAYQDPEFLKAFEALGEPIAIRERSRESAQLKLIPAEEKKPAGN
jgi:hypothetical protein